MIYRYIGTYYIGQKDSKYYYNITEIIRHDRTIDTAYYRIKLLFFFLYNYILYSIPTFLTKVIVPLYIIPR